MPGRILANVHDIVGSHGRPLTGKELPPADVAHWTPARKAEVVAAVRSGRVPLDDVCRRYAMTIEEFMSWSSAVDAHGLPGLQVGNIRRWRE